MPKKKDLNLPVLLAIDPSVRSLGWAIVNLNRAVGNDYYDLENQELWIYGLVTMESTRQIDPSLVKWRWEEAAAVINATFELEGIRPTHLASEWPTFFNSMEGRIAAQQNYTLGLASMVGYIAAAFEFRSEYIALWTPYQWKRNAPKNVTRNQMTIYFGDAGKTLARTASDDVIDAIMIARYWLTLYDRKKFRFQNQPEPEEVIHATRKEDKSCLVKKPHGAISPG